MREVLALVCLVVLAAQAGDAADRFPFVVPWNDASPTAVDVSALNPAPLDESRRIAVRDGHFFDGTGRRVRFVGTNLAAGACFPRKEDAEAVAAHLHKLGFNCVRLHHMDSAWAEPNMFFFEGGSYGKRTDRLDPRSLDRLDYLIYQLKRHGIYVDMNLHVGRGFTAADGFPDTDRLEEMGKVVGYFEPGMIARQELYAQQLLTHRNPYTKLTYAEDPVVALVEITNEDSVLASVDSLATLPPRYRGLLVTGWNRFLSTKYGTTKQLLAAWNRGVQPLGANLLRNPRFAGGEAEWNLETHEQARASMAVEPAAGPGAPAGAVLHLAGIVPDGVGWHLQFNQTGLDLAEGKTYTVSFWAKSTAPRAMTATMGLDDPDWHGIGLSAPVEVTPRWQRFTYSFTVNAPHPQHNRLSFTFGDAAADLYLADLAVQPGGGAVELTPTQTLEAGTVPLPALVDTRPGRDYASYLIEVERDFSQGMYRYLKDDLHTRGAVACTQASYGGIAGAWRESQLDWVDMHNYWQHPWFPNRPWDSNDYRIGNTPMVRDPWGGTLFDLARYRVAGKPFTVSEYDHPAPAEYAAEAVPMLFAYAARQDWDGVFLFAYNGDDTDWNRDYIEGFFDQQSHPGKLAFVPSAAEMFLRGYVPPAPQTQTLLVPTTRLAEFVAKGEAGRLWEKVEQAASLDFLGWRNEVAFVRDGALAARVTGEEGRGPARLEWARSNPAQAVFTVDAPGYKSLVGFPSGRTALGEVTFTAEPTPRGFLAMTLVSLDGKPLAQSRSLLLTLVGKVENPGLEWNAERTFAAHSWEHGPTLAEGVTAQVELQTNAPRAKVYALDGTGAHAHEVVSELSGGRLRFRTRPEDRTLWYEIEALGER